MNMEGNFNRLQKRIANLSPAGASVELGLRWWVPGAEAVAIATAGFRHRRLGASSGGSNRQA